MLKEGVFLGKRYEILGRVGSGGMADVYKGKDHKLNRFVAIKVLKSDYRTDEIFIQKFLSEAQAAAGLMHPNVVNVYDVGQDRGLYYMVMELVEGITLKDYIDKKGRLSAKETISISIQMLSGIQAAHNQHIIHRDIKPQNIIISKEGKVKVTDFGIARATTSTKTISASVMGSVHYTSPEHAKGGVVDEKSDIYSAGITMYEMITGHVPFDGDTTVSVAIKHLQEEITSPAEEVPDIPYSLECIIMKCTQKNHQRRYPNCEALIMDLKRSLVDPEGDFVQSSVYAAGAVDETVVMSSEDMEKIQRRASHTGNYPKIDEDVYDDEDDDALEYDDDDYDDDEDYDYDRKRRSSGELDPNTKRITKILMVVAAIIIGFIVLFMVGKAMGLFQFESKIVSEEKAVQVTVPNILGYTQEDAREELSLKNLGMKVAGQETSDKYEKGQIIRQEPEASTKVDKNTEVKVYISLGKEEELVVVPDVVSYKEDDAQKLLTSKGLVVEFDYDYHDYIEEGKVIQTTPGKGAEVKEGSTITILVSQGIEKIEMVSVLGKTLEEATKILTDAEFEVGTVTEDYSNEYDSGLVMTQSVESGKKTGKGTKVNLVISKGCKDKVSTVPSLAGKTQNEAIRALESAGLKSGYISFEYSSSVMQGYVINQSASPGSEMEKYSMVDFVVSLGPEPSQETQSSN